MRLPEGESFFNRPAQRGDLHVVHLRTASSTERAALLAHSDEIIAGASSSSSSSSSSAAAAYSVLLENKFRSGEFALIAESSAASGEPPEGYPEGCPEGSSSLASRLGEWVSAAPCSETGDVLSFGPPLWPEDMAMQHADIGEEASDAATFPCLSG